MTTASTAVPVGTERIGLRRALAALLVIELFSGFQQSYFTPLFHSVAEQYHVNVTALAWTVTGHALAAAVATPVLAVLGDRHGHLRVLRATVAVVGVGAVLIAIAPGYPLLLAGRVLQGCLAGYLPLMFGLVRSRRTTEDTRRAIAYLSGAMMVGVLLGSVCGSLLLRLAGPAPVLWLPAVGTLAGLGLLRTASWAPDDRLPAPPGSARVDWLGAALLSAGLVSALLALHEGAAWGWSSPPTVGCLCAAALLLAAWTVTALRTPAPLIDVRRLFRPRLLPVFAVGWCVHFVVIGGQVSYATYVTLPDGLGLPPTAVGLVLLPAFCGMALFSTLTTRIGRAIGYRRATVLGAALLVAGTTGVLLRHSGAGDFAVLLGLAGSGMGLISGAGRILVIDHLRAEETAAGEGLFELLVSLGSAVGSAVLGAILAAQGSGHHGYQTAWAVGAVVALLGLAASSALSRRTAEKG
ncbi:MFS transporter [Streptomyces sp. LS1784]|uniref:MFS transporter n=1 Tax=Streptomyces sp. LS1784 TaxID=2851533 RepID=UPI001CCE370F|nr:MFS transporter [Streptomyces sp. LS1784]